jgi:hypothetical protein
MSDNKSSNSQSSPDIQSNSANPSNVDNSSLSSVKKLQSGDILKPGSRLRYISDEDIRNICLEGHPRKTTD